jgi:hypothetical protein
MQGRGSPYAILVAIVVVLAVLVLCHYLRKTNTVATTRKGATECLSYTAEWTKWMAGVQTAALGFLALAALDSDYLYGRSLGPCQNLLVVVTFFLLGSALLASAWVLSSIPAQSIRLHSVKASDDELKEAFDIYEQPLWINANPEEAEGSETGKRNVFTFGYLVTVKHTLWILGLLSAGALAGTIYATPPEKKVDSPKVDAISK